MQLAPRTSRDPHTPRIFRWPTRGRALLAVGRMPLSPGSAPTAIRCSSARSWAAAAVRWGVTSSSNFPLLHPLQASRRGSSPDAFVAKLTAAGSLSYSTYLGGTGVDMANAIAVDASGSAYVVGGTFSTRLA